jgi:hypothetical protein
MMDDPYFLVAHCRLQSIMNHDTQVRSSYSSGRQGHIFEIPYTYVCVHKVKIRSTEFSDLSFPPCASSC